MIRVVVVDDSAVARQLLSRMLESDPEIEVVGTAMNGVFALRRIYRDKPDVVTMDFEMPQMDGLETLKAVMERHPTPIVMLSARTYDGADLTVRALELGAVDFVPKPDGRQSQVLGNLQAELIRKIKAAAQAHLRKKNGTAKRAAKSTRPPPPKKQPKPTPAPQIDLAAPAGPVPRSSISLIAIGSSTGGVPGVDRILRSLPENAPPTLVVQHMPATFTSSFASRLNSAARVTVKEAEGGEVLKPGLALIARGSSHLGVRQSGGSLVAEISDEPKVSGHKPSVDYLFDHCAEVAGAGCVGVILTGMGKDGAKGLRHIRDAGGRTVAENEQSCVIYGMPKAAVQLDAAEFVLGSKEIPDKLADLTSVYR